MLLGSLGFVTFTAFVPLHAEDVGLDDVAIPLTVNAATNLLTRLVGAPLADRVDRRVLTGVSLVIVATAASTLALWAAPAGLVVAAVLNGAGNAYLFPGFLAMTVDAAPEADRARAIGSLTMFSDLANSVGGALLGLAASAAGYRGAFACSRCARSWFSSRRRRGGPRRRRRCTRSDRPQPRGVSPSCCQAASAGWWRVGS